MGASHLALAKSIYFSMNNETIFEFCFRMEISEGVIRLGQYGFDG